MMTNALYSELDIATILSADPSQPPSDDLFAGRGPNKPFVDPNFSQYYPSNWPYAMPFHAGEVALQKATGVHEHVMSYAPNVIRPYLPDQHREFFQNQPFLVVAARDEKGDMWSTLLMNHDATQMTESPDPVTFYLDAKPVPGDALENAFQELNADTDVGILGIEFATKRRNRVNGRVRRGEGDGSSKLIFKVDQSFGNCPQYIKPRAWWRVPAPTAKQQTQDPVRLTKLSPEQITRIGKAVTIFVATGYRGGGDDVRYGNDSSHRGGPAGFVRVIDDRTIVLPEFAGNNHMNSLGNLLLDNRMGVTVPDLENGGLLQLTGTAVVDYDSKRAEAFYPGALRLITFHIKKVNEVPTGSLPIRFSVGPEERALVVSSIVQESSDVKSFYIKPHHLDNKPLKGFVAGQHLPIRLTTPKGELLRTYSLSSAASSANPDYYRISVKKHWRGKASSFLHDSIKVGDTITVEQPAGDFVLKEMSHDETDQPSTVVLISAGIGVTPIYAMLQELLDDGDSENQQRPIVWIHAARNNEHHVFADNVEILVSSATPAERVKKHVVYSQPSTAGDSDNHDSKWRVNEKLIQSLVQDWKDAEYFMCGPGAFLASIEYGLGEVGVSQENIHYELF